MYPKLYVARRERNLYQKDVAKKLGIHLQTYHEKESGKRDFTLREARMLAKIFDCTLNDLFW
ncbi:helix-turn-helix domain-containing protein [Caldifermentibacillus hisashii]|uniref:helix-turn-helix transcriptional regulator n=1 Tax=Caldifermentibacillus hisashii TaxID=996558 RepID=UPI0031FE3710